MQDIAALINVFSSSHTPQYIRQGGRGKSIFDKQKRQCGKVYFGAAR